MIPNLKSFMKSFSSGFGVDMDVSNYGTGHSYRLESLKGEQGEQKNQSINRSANRSNSAQPPPSLHGPLRPDYGEHIATVQPMGGARKRLGDNVSEDGSQEMIIVKNLQYNVSYEP